MSETTKPEIGRIIWRDLTVGPADAVRDFYKEVVGWEVEEISMGDYSDYSMIAPGTHDAVAGVCHARGCNESLPSQWLIYITVENLEQSTAACTRNGGHVVQDIRALGTGRFCVVRDPAGAVCALYQE